METFNISLKGLDGKFDVIDKLVDQGIALGLDLSDVKSKIQSIKSMVNDGIIRIVLLGSFSDGKTTAVAGLLGRLDDSMKIDSDESSDELTVYRPDGLKEGFEIVDTPGLFGSKEKEVDGRMVKFSKITEKYISEAHIVIYVCDAVNPLKDSHVPIIKKVLRDFGKLDSTIFVINKMDEAGYDMTDESDYKNGSNIKKKTLISRLRSTIDLTSAEEKRLQIICIAADPKGKGLEYWFSKADAYLSRSHINLLRDEVNKVVGCAVGDELKQSAVLASIKDAMGQVTSYISENGGDTEKMLKKCEESCGDLSSDLESLNRQLLTSQADLSDSLNNYEDNLIADINGASLETFGDIVDRCLGVENDKVTFYVVQSKVNSYMQRASNDANSCVSATAVDFDRELSNQESWLAGAAKKGAGFLRMAKVSREQVFAVRNLLFSSHKFKPWCAVKMASNITKCLAIAGTVISVAIDVYSWYKKHKAEKELNESKKAIVEALRKYFAEVAKTYSDGNAFFENYAPQYMEMKKALEEREGEIRNFQNKVKELSVYKKRVASFLKGGEYVDYQEVN